MLLTQEIIRNWYRWKSVNADDSGRGTRETVEGAMLALQFEINFNTNYYNVWTL